MFWKSFLVKIPIAIFFIQSVFAGECPDEEIKECFSQQEFDDAIKFARIKQGIIENMIGSAYNVPGVQVNEDETAFHHFHTVEIDEDVFNANRDSAIIISALQSIKIARNYTKAQLEICLKTAHINVANCPSIPVDCKFDDTDYYRVDGKCNNKDHPLNGAKKSALERVFQNGFPDGLDYSVSNTYQRSARDDAQFANSLKPKLDASKFPQLVNDAATIYGQIMIHELIDTRKVQPSPKQQGGGYNCCAKEGDSFKEGVVEINKECWPIEVPDDDVCYKDEGTKCLNYFQSIRTMEEGCDLSKPPAPTNLHTPYFDAELVYNELSLDHLGKNGGKFNLADESGIRDMLLSYDARTETLPGLYLFIHHYLELHNMVFDYFKGKRDDLSDDILSFESRKVVTGVYQKIIVDYASEFLPDSTEADVDKFYDGCYDPSLEPQATIEFNICLRFFHYFIRETWSTYDEGLFSKQGALIGQTPVERDLAEYIGNLGYAKDNRCGLRHGLMDANWNVGQVGPQVNCKFFGPKDRSKTGHDLRSMDYQFARISGEPSYIEVLRDFYGVGKDKCDEQFEKSDLLKHSDKNRNILWERTNGRLADVGFTLGVELETKEGGPLPPTCTNIILNQFKKSICSDRFFYSNATFLNDDQKKGIEEFEVRDLFCVTNEQCHGTKIQEDPLDSPGPDNTKKSCDSVENHLKKLKLDEYLKSY